MVYSFLIDARIREATLFSIVAGFGWLSTLIYDEIQYKRPRGDDRTEREKKIDWALLGIVCVNALDIIRSIMLYGIT